MNIQAPIHHVGGKVTGSQSTQIPKLRTPPDTSTHISDTIESIISMGYIARVRHLNDTLRLHGSGGRIEISEQVCGLTQQQMRFLYRCVQEYAFESSDDPYGFHDWGMVPIFGNRYEWKILYLPIHESSYISSPDTKRILQIWNTAEQQTRNGEEIIFYPISP